MHKSATGKVLNTCIKWFACSLYCILYSATNQQPETHMLEEQPDQTEGHDLESQESMLCY